MGAIHSSGRSQFYPPQATILSMACELRGDYKPIALENRMVINSFLPLWTEMFWGLTRSGLFIDYCARLFNSLPSGWTTAFTRMRTLFRSLKTARSTQHVSVRYQQQCLLRFVFSALFTAKSIELQGILSRKSRFKLHFIILMSSEQLSYILYHFAAGKKK